MTARINAGDLPIYEIGLEDLLKRQIGRNLRATTDLQQAVADSEISRIAVFTPFDGSAIVSVRASQGLRLTVPEPEFSDRPA